MTKVSLNFAPRADYEEEKGVGDFLRSSDNEDENSFDLDLK